ncbi:unnamed protein product [Cochlearia groenlandica]
MLTTTHTNIATSQIENPKGVFPNPKRLPFRMYQAPMESFYVRLVALGPEVKEKDQAFLTLTEQLNKMNAYMMSRFADYDGTGSGAGSSGTGSEI